MTELERLIAHEGEPCKHCQQPESDRFRPSTCKKRRCSVLGCLQPRDPNYPASDSWMVWCTGHGELYRRMDEMSAERHGKINQANVDGRIFRLAEGSSA